MPEQYRNINFNLDNIPPMPLVAAEILSLLNSPLSSAGRLADIVASDPAVAARVLRIANSSFYSMSRQVTNLSMAIVVLGERTLKNLVLAASLRGINRVFGPREKMLWEDSMVCALGSRFLSRSLGIGDPEDAFVAGLFRHIGLIVMNNQQGSDVDFIIESLRFGSQREAQERELFGATHAEIGAAVLEHWNLSESLCYVARYHAAADLGGSVDSDLAELTALVNLAGNFPGHFGILGMPRQVDFAALPGAQRLHLEGERLLHLVRDFREIFEQNRRHFLA